MHYDKQITRYSVIESTITNIHKYNWSSTKHNKFLKLSIIFKIGAHLFVPINKNIQLFWNSDSHYTFQVAVKSWKVLYPCESPTIHDSTSQILNTLHVCVMWRFFVKPGLNFTVLRCQLLWRTLEDPYPESSGCRHPRQAPSCMSFK